MSDLNNDIERYLNGEMTPKEMHALEKKALSDPFLADALEGGSLSGEHFSKDVKAINKRIQPAKSYTLRIAAGVVVLISVGLYLFWPAEEQQQIVKQEEVQKVDPAKIDSVVQEEVPAKKDERPAIALKKKKTSEPTTEPTQQPATIVTPDSIPESMLTEEVQVETIPAHVIAGTVTTSEDNLPLPGVSILIKGTTQGTTTDVNGHYSLEVPDSSSLVFSFVGMQPTEMSVANKATADVKLSEDVSQLGEVVIARAPIPRPDMETPDIKLAEPTGGLRAYDKYLEDNKRYPQQALDNDVKGRVIVGFDVGISGELSNFVVIRSLGHGCDDEVIRLIKEGPAWKPTTESNVPVESTVHVKMKFDAAKFKKKR